MPSHSKIINALPVLHIPYDIYQRDEAKYIPSLVTFTGARLSAVGANVDLVTVEGDSGSDFLDPNTYSTSSSVTLFLNFSSGITKIDATALYIYQRQWNNGMPLLVFGNSLVGEALNSGMLRARYSSKIYFAMPIKISIILIPVNP